MIGMEACSGAHFLGRVLREQGHDGEADSSPVREAIRESNKNDYLDAEAIAEAVDRQNMRFVPIKRRTISLISRRCIVCATALSPVERP